MASITFKTKVNSLWSLVFYNSVTDTYTLKGSQGNPWGQELFPLNAVVGDAICFGGGTSFGRTGKWHDLLLNLQTALAATNITGVWEVPSSGQNRTKPLWSPIPGLVDNTNAFQTAGINTVAFIPPQDWINFVLSIGASGHYQWFIRFRITSLTGLTAGGALSPTPHSSRHGRYEIAMAGHPETAPCTYTDIHNADVAGNWGVVTKKDNQFSFNCNVWNEDSNFLQSKQESIQFEENFYLTGGANNSHLVGIVSSKGVSQGSSFTFLGRDVNYPAALAGSNSTIVNSSFRHIRSLNNLGGFNGYWGGAIGSRDNQVVSDVYIEGFRQVDFSNADNVVIGATARNAHVERPGAIIKNFTSFEGAFCFRPVSLNRSDYIHECDLSRCISSPINPWTVGSVADWHIDFVDCNWGAFVDAHKVRWQIRATQPHQDMRVYETASILIKLTDGRNIPLSNARLRLTDKNGAEVLNIVSNADGVCGVDTGTATTTGMDFIEDNTKTWTPNKWHFQELVMTSGDAVNERIILRRNNTAIRVTTGWDFIMLPVIGDRFIIVPYVRYKVFVPAGFANGSQWSIPTDQNPFNLTITKSGYKTIKRTIELTGKIDWSLTMERNRFIEQKSI